MRIIILLILFTFAPIISYGDPPQQERYTSFMVGLLKTVKNNFFRSISEEEMQRAMQQAYEETNYFLCGKQIGKTEQENNLPLNATPLDPAAIITLLQDTSQRCHSTLDRAVLQMVNRTLTKIHPMILYIPVVSHDGEEDSFGFSQDWNDQGNLITLNIIPGSAADRAGFHAGETILTIDQTPVLPGMSDRDINILMYTPSGSPKTFTVAPPGGNPRSITATATDDHPKFPPMVAKTLENQFGYLRLRRFHEDDYAETVLALEKFAQQGLQNLMIDLRGNRGGKLDDLEKMAGLFLAKNTTIFTTRKRDSHRIFHNFPLSPLAEPWKFNMVVLMDGYAGSAAALLSEALRHHCHAMVIGSRSSPHISIRSLIPFGSPVWSAQKVNESPLAGVVHMPTSEVLTPNKQPFPTEGMEPDRRVEPSEEENFLLKRYGDSIFLFDGTGSVVQTGLTVLRERKP